MSFFSAKYSQEYYYSYGHHFVWKAFLLYKVLMTFVGPNRVGEVLWVESRCVKWCTEWLYYISAKFVVCLPSPHRIRDVGNQVDGLGFWTVLPSHLGQFIVTLDITNFKCNFSTTVSTAAEPRVPIFDFSFVLVDSFWSIGFRDFLPSV